MPFDPSVIPFFSILYFYALFKWVSGKLNFFPLLLFLIAILYNLELATFTLFFPFILILAYGFIKRKNFAIRLLNLKYLFYSLLFLIIPMIPVLIYDFSNGFKQTVIFLGWIIYKPFSFLINHTSGNLISNLNIIINFILISLQKLIFQPNLFLAVVIFLLSIALLIYLILSDKRVKIDNSKFLLLFLLTISFAGIFLNQTPSDAYLPIIFPFIIFTVAIFFDYLQGIKKIRYYVALGIIILLSFNFYSTYKNSSRPDYFNW